MKLQTLKRELKYSLFAWRLYRRQNEAQLKWGQTPNRTQEKNQLRRCKLLIVRIDLYYTHQNIENYNFN
jgi:hypothetical protein